MDNPNLVTEEQLKELTGYQSRKALRDWLDSRGIWYLDGRGGRIGTTVRALDQAGVDHPEEIEFK